MQSTNTLDPLNGIPAETRTRCANLKGSHVTHTPRGHTNWLLLLDSHQNNRFNRATCYFDIKKEFKLALGVGLEPTTGISPYGLTVRRLLPTRLP